MVYDNEEGMNEQMQRGVMPKQPQAPQQMQYAPPQQVAQPPAAPMAKPMAPAMDPERAMIAELMGRGGAMLRGGLGMTRSPEAPVMEPSMGAPAPQASGGGIRGLMKLLMAKRRTGPIGRL